MKTFIKFVIISTLSLSTFFQNSFSNEKIKIGLIVPLSGIHSQLGNSIIKSVRLAVNKINDDRIEIIPKDTKSNPINTLRSSKELYELGVRIVIGPVFNESSKYLDELKDMTFISLTNKIYGNHSNVISAGINAISQINTINKFRKINNLERSIALVPNTDYKKEINLAIDKSNIKLKEKFYYDTDPTLLTAQIEKLTRYPQRKQNLEDEITRLHNVLKLAHIPIPHAKQVIHVASETTAKEKGTESATDDNLSKLKKLQREVVALKSVLNTHNKQICSRCGWGWHLFDEVFKLHHNDNEV